MIPSLQFRAAVIGLALAEHDMTIRAVFFDAAGTLIQPTRPVGQSYALIAAKYGKEISVAEISERFRICFEASPPLAFGPAATTPIEQLERRWWKQLVRCVFASAGSFDRFDEYFDELFSYFAQPQAWALYPDVALTLSHLRQRGLILNVVSNFDSRLLGILDGLGAAAWFQDVFISSRIGFAKPARQIFEHVLARQQLAPGDVIHVGDSEAGDLRGADNAGIKALLIDRDSRPPARSPRHITNLTEIVAAVDQG